MPRFRRCFVPGGTYFFTVVTHRRRRILCEPGARAILRSVFVECQSRWPFSMDAIVLLPDHLHAIWTLPPEDDAYPRRWGWIKKEFTKRWLRVGGTEAARTDGYRRERRRGVWQPKYWEHTLFTLVDYEHHMDYIHYNPRKHGLVERPIDWPYSSLHRYVRLGTYPPDWGAGVVPPNLDISAGE